MGHVLMKPKPDVDEYVYWSTVVDNVLAVGTREQLEECYPDELAGKRFARRWKRADANGTSEYGMSYSDGDSLVAYNIPGLGCRILPFANLSEFAYAMCEGDVETCKSLTSEPED